MNQTEVSSGAAGPSPASADALRLPETSRVDLSVLDEDVTVAPFPLRAGYPFTVTAVIHNNGVGPAEDIPVILYLAPLQEQIGFTPFLDVLTVTLATTQSLPVHVPVVWNLAGGEYRLWLQVNRVPIAWQPSSPTRPEDDLSDNLVALDLLVDTFDAYETTVCPGRVDAEIGPADVRAGSDQEHVLVRVHNLGNRAFYNLPVVILGSQATGLAYSPALAPCGGSADVAVGLDRPLEDGELLTVLVNPQDWEGALSEDDLANNQITTTAELLSSTTGEAEAGLDAYDFSISTSDMQAPEPWILLVTAHNLGTRDAGQVPIRVENQAGRRLADLIPLVEGNGLGVAAIRVGYLWTRGGTLTVTVNPPDAKGAYPEANRENNSAAFTLP